jgi:hypothetical protein
VDNTDPEIYKEYYEIAAGSTSPGRPAGYFDLYFKKFEVDSACAKYSTDWSLRSSDVDFSTLETGTMNNKDGYFVVNTNVPMSAEVILYRGVEKPNSEDGISYGVQYIPGF